MKNVQTIEFREGGKEELLPNFQADFPYICSYVELDNFTDKFVPWHWHKEVELFYIQKGCLEYYTPKGKIIFPAGSGGLVNSNVLHMTKPREGIRDTTQIEHIFDTSLIGGQQGSLIEQKYVTPLISAHQIELLGLYPEDAAQQEILEMISASFLLCKDDYAYEIRLRTTLSEIWCRLLDLSGPLRREKESYNKANDKIKLMMIYIHEHYEEKLTTAELAAAAFISERECFRAFRDCLHMTPVEYLNSYRLQKACHLLAQTKEPITAISHSCGLGSSSYFGKLFRKYRGCTPLEYRNEWQDNDTIRQE